MYGKIFDSMYEGTLYGHWEAIVTLQQMLVLCTSTGVLDMTPQAISARTSIPLEIITKGIEILSQPDRYSRTPGEDGKRIVLMDEHRPWGWQIVNHSKYKAMQSRAEKNEADRLRMAEKRRQNKDVADSSGKSHPVAGVAHADADANAAAKATTGAAARGARLPKDWVLPKSWGEWALKEQPTWTPEHVRKIATIFKNHWLSASGRGAAKLDWEKTWQNWVLKEGALKGAAVRKPWFLTSSGIDAKGREQGKEIPTGSEEWRAFKDRVLADAGVTAEMISNAKKDFP